ncbi:uncharacterized protein MONBRDRAFT_36290 [Monosiga brevicollis MX1]|uniref:OsmC-like protein n=1 Tax=Monosiga brevicollis TaxID=81824 RepID=A9UUQ4_MONBE|nr:uncharacterized protein MONBRDRAFT_36290 [Monosiga brevicollis MX1]EDQ90944.1 predicted protein [Monosiga brevicollis MX1]|eukprot:XP_001744241.1 hypothetical protein [Monosiga brevicollis MX1]
MAAFLRQALAGGRQLSMLAARPSSVVMSPAVQLAARRFKPSFVGEDGWVQVEETLAGPPYQNVVLDGRHETLVDEPMTFPDGQDTGMNPYQFLVASLGACTSVTVRLYANRNNIPLERIRVFTKHDRIYAKDCETCTTKTGKVDKIFVKVQLEGDLTADQRNKLMQIANFCPVHKTLTTETIVDVAAME